MPGTNASYCWRISAARSSVMFQIHESGCANPIKTKST